MFFDPIPPSIAPWDAPLTTSPHPLVKADPPAVKTEITEEEVGQFVNQIQGMHDALKEVNIGIDIGQFAPWSYSKYKSLAKCPFQFYLKYVVKFKLPAHYQIQSDPVSANRGKAAHRILELVLVGKSVDDSFAETKKEFVQVGRELNEEQWEELVVPLYANVIMFKDRIDAFDREHGIRKIYTELRLGITRDYKPAGFFANDVWLRGVIDLILMLACTDIIILDHKTGGGQGSVRNYRSQLNWYKVLFHFGVTAIAGAQPGVHFIEAGDVKMDDYSEAADIENNIKNEVEVSLEDAVNALESYGYFKHIRGGYCKWCEFDQIGCKSGALKPLELSTKKWIQIYQEKKNG